MIEEKTLPRRSMQPDEIRHYNNEIVYQLSRFLTDAPRALRIRDIRKIHEECDVSMDFAFATVLASLIGLQIEGRDRDFFRNYYLPMIHALDARQFRRNNYYQKIRIPEKTIGQCALTKKIIEPAEGFVCGDFKVTSDGRLIPSLGFFDESFIYPAVLERNREWMTLMPNETITTDPCAKQAFGHVLTFGLGLGYFVFKALENEQVRDVTVVELNRDVISLFEQEILPQFPNRDRVRIICADALEFVRSENLMKQYDYLFADIWHDVGDGRELYLKIKSYEDRYPSVKFTYWIEDTIKCYLEPKLWPEQPR
ncbi:MAG: hypothetical protein II710_07110 [Clostridia bacterium]|nr:hypothetical protein [Clostridia bacterium]